MKDYRLVINANSSELSSSVRELLVMGYICLGGVVVKENKEVKNGFWYIQSMVKE